MVKNPRYWNVKSLYWKKIQSTGNSNPGTANIPGTGISNPALEKNPYAQSSERIASS
jgi:hypothetical protein